MWHHAQEIALSPKTGATVASLTAGTGAATVLDLIPESIDRLYNVAGVFGLTAGGILSLTLAAVHVARYRLERRKFDRENRDAD